MRNVLHRLFFALACICMLVYASPAHSQIVNNWLYYGNDSFSTYCQTPTTGYIYTYGLVNGTVTYPDSVTFLIRYGDGTDSTFKAPIDSQGNYLGYHPHVYTYPGTFTPMVITTTSNNISDTAMGLPIAISNECGSLTGTVFLDANGNCLQDAGEQILAWRTIKIINTTTLQEFLVFTDLNGHYAINLDEGFTYTIRPPVGPGSDFVTTCVPDSGATITIAPGISYVQDFGMSCDSVLGDVTINAWMNTLCRGKFQPFYVHVPFNTFCDTFAAQVTVSISAALWFDTTAWSVPPVSQTTTTATWDITSANTLTNWLAIGYVYCDTSINVGADFYWNVAVTTTPHDVNDNNNFNRFTAKVTDECKQNEKLVSGERIQLSGWIRSNPSNSEKLNYLIRFQNPGPDTAHSVMIIDTLDTDFAWDSFELLGASHPVSVTFGDSGLVRLRFDNIDLPDSSTNPLASQGFVCYSVNAKPIVRYYTLLNNTANILFDYNATVRTNTTYNFLGWVSVYEVSKDHLLLVYPNPTQDQLYVEVPGQASFRAVLYNIMGQSVATLQGQEGKNVLPVAGLARGMYNLVVVMPGGLTKTTRVVLQ